MTWCDIQLGPSGSVRPDVYTIFKSYVRPAPMAYECKVSAADFFGDVTAGKWQAYLKYATGVYFAVEAGLGVTKDNVPAHCGLIVYRDSWRVAKKPVLSPVTIPQDALLTDGVEREGPVYRRRHWIQSDVLVRMRQQFGEVTARVIRDRLAVEDEIADARHTASRIEDDARRAVDLLKQDLTPMRAQLCEVLGLPESAPLWDMKSAVAKIRSDVAQHPAERQLKSLTQSIQRAIERDGWSESHGS